MRDVFVMLARFLKLAFVLFCACAASGCWAHYHYRHGPPAASVGVVYVRRAPPPPRHVRIPPRPAPTAIWIDGYWRWSGVEFVWVEGFWDRNPPPGKVWAPGRWVHTSRGWYWQPGRWR